MFEGMQNYTNFSDRATRKEYWLFFLLYLIALIFAMMADYVISTISPNAAGYLTLLVYCIFIIPAISVTVRRFHDQDLSGWFILLVLIPFAGGIILFVFACLDGTHGENRFGPDPKGREAPPSPGQKQAAQ